MEHVKHLKAERRRAAIRVKKAWKPGLTKKSVPQDMNVQWAKLNGELKQNYTEILLAIVSLKRHKNWTPKKASPWRLPPRKDKSNV